jgi:hypothetical protein
MQSTLHLIAAHPIVSTLAGMALLNSAVGAMEKPNEKNGQLYRYIYRFGHILCFNVKFALKAKFPEYIPDQPSPDEVK